MGGELGSLTASMLEEQPWVGSLMGIDVDPPRRRLKRAEFHRIEPGNRDRIVDVVTGFDPHVLIHLAVWEPDARAGLAHARQFTRDAGAAFFGAAAECPSLQRIVVRSGIEVYGRARHSPTRPTEDSPVQPSSSYGTMLAELERTAASIGDRIGVPVASLRLAPVLGPHVPSPLGRLLRQPVVPFSALADSPFVVVEDLDAARAFVAAGERSLDKPVNVVASGAITALQAILRGRKLPLPLVGPEWMLARQLSHLLGAPVPDHVIEVMHRGRLADGGRAAEMLGVSPATTTSRAIERLFEWPSVVRIPSIAAVA
jgi:UDP-glucose 4-epimerase